MDHIEISKEFRIGISALRDVANALPKACKCLPELPHKNSDLFRIKDDSILAIGTNDLVITLEPTERLRELVAAVRARERKNSIAEIA
jgi:hypothetical protein